MSDDTALNHCRLGFIGAGNMAQALIGGLLANGFTPERIAVSDPSPACCEAAEKLGVHICDDNQALIASSDIVILAVKPQVMQAVLEPLAQSVESKRPLIISIAAGVTAQMITEWLAADAADRTDVAVVRCMPNTPALLREGATALFANEQVSTEQHAQAQAIMNAVGLALWVETELELDAVTALSGSGPAYFFLMIELMQRAGEKMGLSSDVSSQLTLRTALGAAKMAVESDVDVVELRRRVTSPNGTTHAAIESFLDNGFADVVEKAVTAARDRSVEMSK